MAGAPVPARRAPWIFSEFAGAKLDVFGLATDDAKELTVGPGIYAWVLAGKVVQLAILDGALAPDVARELVERRAAADDVPR
jgi:hypothetical protein